MNYATKCVHYFVLNMDAMDQYWHDQARKHLDNPDKLAEQLRSVIDSQSPTLRPSLYADLLCEAMRSVDCRELAHLWIGDIRAEEGAIR